jgi:cell division protein FtsW
LEEIGFLWWSILLTLYILLAWYTSKGLMQVDDYHDKVLWFGILSLILIQAFINMGVNTNLLPLTGLTLPFVSHGWSALLVNIIESTLLVKIINQKKLAK